jgi:hypothetical protein
MKSLRHVKSDKVLKVSDPDTNQRSPSKFFLERLTGKIKFMKYKRQSDALLMMHLGGTQEASITENHPNCQCPFNAREIGKGGVRARSTTSS